MSVGTRDNTVSPRTRRALHTRVAPAPIESRGEGSLAAGEELSLWRTVAGRLTPHEWRRRMVHMSPGLLPIILLVAPHSDPVGWLVQLPILALTLGLVVFALRNEGLFVRRGEKSWGTSVISYGIITTTLLMALPAQPELGLVVTIVIAFGDGSATLAGLIFGGPRLPWNRAKSWVGLAAFLGISIPIATLVYWGEARPGVALPVALACVAPAALAAALAESFPSRINDNIRVGITAAVTILISHGIVVGW
jgi:dolichol kinase